MVTIKELAKKAGVSPSTASIVVNGKARERSISLETEQRVLEAAKELGYTPNLSARSLRDPNQKNRYQIALYWTTDYRLTLMVRFLRGLQERLLEITKDIELIIITYGNGKLNEVVNQENLVRYHGVIICNANDQDLKYLNESTFTIPIVLYNRFLDKYSTVNIDNYSMGVEAANICISNNRKNVLLIDQDLHFPGIEYRLNGFYDTLKEFSIPVNKVKVTNNQQSGYELAKQLYKEKKLPEYVFSLSDVAAIGFIQYLRQQSLNIPQDMDVIAIGTIDKDFYKISSLPLSTIDVPMEEMAKTCLNIVINHIEDPLSKLKTEIVPIEYNFRDSTL